MLSVSIALAETMLSAQAVQMHNPQIAQLHKLCVLIFKKKLQLHRRWESRVQKLAQFGRKDSPSMLTMLAAFCISEASECK